MNNHKRELDDLPELDELHTVRQEFGVEPQPPFPPRDSPQIEFSLSQRFKKFTGSVAAAGTLAMATGGAVGEAVAAVEQSKSATTLPASEAAVIKGFENGKYPNVVWNGAILLPAGTAINARPGGEQGSEIHRVNRGYAVLLQRPRLLQDGKKTWAAVSLAAKANKPNQATSASQVYWVDLTKAERSQGFRSFVYKNSDSNIKNIDVDINSKHNLVTKEQKPITGAGVATMQTLGNRLVKNTLKKLKLAASKEKPHITISPPAVTPESGSPVQGPQPPPESIVPKPDNPITPVQPPPEIDPTDPNSGPLENLPGSKDILTPQEKALYRDSQVQFLRNGQNWIDATLISYQGKLYALTCLHGITADLIAQNPAKNYKPDGYFTTDQISSPTDLLPQIGSAATYTIGAFGGNQVVATSMIALPEKDLLLVGLGDQSAASRTGKALAVETTNFGGDKARPGANVYAFGESQASGFKPVGGDEIFADVVNLQSYNGENREMFAVGDNVENYTTAPNGFGTSGRAVIVKNQDGSYSFLIGNSVRFFRPDRRGQLLPGDYPPGADWVESRIRQHFANITFGGPTDPTGYELYSSVSKNEILSMISIAK